MGVRGFALDDTAALPTADEKRRLDELATGFLREFKIPGISVAFAHWGSLAYAAGYGLTDVRNKQPVSGESTFRIASISKCFTSVAIYTLVEQGKISLDDRVFGSQGILAHFNVKTTHRDWLESIEVRHLLTHTAGGWSHDPPDPSYMWPELNQEEMLQQTISTVALKTQPGTNFAYSNIGFLLLGRVIEERSRQHYRDYVRDHVLTPCGITTMFIGENTPNSRRREVTYYAPEFHGEIDIPRRDSCGAWVATPSDLVRFALHVDGYKDPPDILKGSSILDMTTPTRANPRYAKGWSVNQADNWWHSGKLPGTASILVRTNGGMCWAAMTNRTGDAVDPALDKLMWQMARSVAIWHA
jgi:CubicO group peptidase (beta-lactamase class C family)